MAIRILDGPSVDAALPMRAAIDAVRRAYVAASAQAGEAPDRTMLELPGGANVALMMPAYLPAGDDAAASLVVKTVSVFPGNPQRGRPMNQGAVVAIDPDTGAPSGLLDAAAVTRIRTAAGSAVATECLARRDAAVLAIIGAGALAPAHAEAICAVREIREIRLFSRTDASRKRCRAQICEHAAPGPDVRCVESAAEAVRGADIVCTLTPASAPVFADGDLAPGTHINAVGAFRPSMCELPSETVARSTVFVDESAAARVEAGDLIQAVAAGHFDWSRAVELGAVASGTHAGRTASDAITLFKSVGIALQDAAAVSVALANADRDDIGHVMPWA